MIRKEGVYTNRKVLGPSTMRKDAHCMRKKKKKKIIDLIVTFSRAIVHITTAKLKTSTFSLYPEGGWGKSGNVVHW